MYPYQYQEHEHKTKYNCPSYASGKDLHSGLQKYQAQDYQGTFPLYRDTDLPFPFRGQ